MTDAAAMNILFLSTGAQNQLLRQYFSPEGERGDMVLTGRDRSFREYSGDETNLLIKKKKKNYKKF